ncbi:CDP-alcohol phosphatidyltransferase family protein [Quadrisphaera setariae]|nr:CDP-alcohol phosphatidyltransferase family protein [Quadrisphaera setariae]
MAESARRPLKTRGRSASHAAATWLARRGATPNGISVVGLLLAVAAGACLLLSGGADPAADRTAGPGTEAVLLVAAAVGVQLRLAANMLDGLVAVECGRGTRTGPLFNEVPDRLADLAVLVPAGYAVGGGWGAGLGWAAGVLAVLTAYVRLLGGSFGQEQRFSGPMAKPHRMFAITLACLVGAVEVLASGSAGVALTAGLVVVVIGSALTCVLRLRAVAAGLP